MDYFVSYCNFNNSSYPAIGVMDFDYSLCFNRIEYFDPYEFLISLSQIRFSEWLNYFFLDLIL